MLLHPLAPSGSELIQFLLKVADDRLLSLSNHGDCYLCLGIARMLIDTYQKEIG